MEVQILTYMHKRTFQIEKKNKVVQCFSALGKKIKVILLIEDKHTTKNIFKRISVVLIHPRSCLSYHKIIFFFLLPFSNKKNTKNKSNFLTTENTNNIKFLKLIIFFNQISKPE